MRALVLDTSALITGFGPASHGNTYTVSEVIGEIKNRDLKLKVELFLEDGSLKIMEPSEEALKRAERAARKSGDISSLSGADLKVIALVIELERQGANVAVMTDDYAVQNVIKILGMSFKPGAEMGIKKIIKWKKVCTACKKRFAPDFENDCTHCGSKLRVTGAKTR